jgi:hypothetical protein
MTMMPQQERVRLQMHNARRERARIRHTQSISQNQVAPVFCTCFKMSTLNTMQGQRESKPKTADCLSPVDPFQVVTLNLA